MSSDDRAIIGDGGKYFFSVLAIILGLINPAAALGASISKETLEFAEAVRRRRANKCRDRLATLVIDLQRRVSALESVVVDDDGVDLLLEVTKKAVEDDETRKGLYYAGAIEWIVRDKPTAAQVRILSDAIRALSFIELAYFVMEVSGRHVRSLLESELPESTVVARLAAMGLSESASVRYHGSPTALGRVVAKYAPLEVVRSHLTATEHARL